MHNYGKIMATVLVTLQGLTAAGYLLSSDWKRALYWALCCALSATYTFLGV